MGYIIRQHIASIAFGLPDVELVAIFAWNAMDYTARSIFWDGIFRLGK